jgi:hypothetical protein
MAEPEDLRRSAPAAADDQDAEERVSERKPSQRIVDRIAVWQQRTAMSKELATAAVAVVIVLTTLGITVAGVFWVHGAEGRGAAKDTLIFLNGLVGVVLGYYFGRIPGESRADRAESDAIQARRSRDQLVAGVRELLASAGVEPEQHLTAASKAATLSPQQVERLRRLLQMR